MVRWIGLICLAVGIAMSLAACGGGTEKNADALELSATGAVAGTSSPKSCDNGLSNGLETCVAVKPAAAASDNTM